MPRRSARRPRRGQATRCTSRRPRHRTRRRRRSRRWSFWAAERIGGAGTATPVPTRRVRSPRRCPPAAVLFPRAGPGRGSGPAGADHGGRGVPAEAEARAGRRVPGGVAGYRNRASRRRVVAIARAQPRRENVESSRISRSAISRGAAFSRTRARTNILLFERPQHIWLQHRSFVTRTDTNARSRSRSRSRWPTRPTYAPTTCGGRRSCPSCTTGSRTTAWCGPRCPADGARSSSATSSNTSSDCTSPSRRTGARSTRTRWWSRTWTSSNAGSRRRSTSRSRRRAARRSSRAGRRSSTPAR